MHRSCNLNLIRFFVFAVKYIQRRKRRYIEVKKKKKKVNKFLHLFLSTNTKNPSTVRKTRFLESRRKRKRKKIIDNEFVNYPNANSSRRCIIIKSDIGDNLEVKPFRAIILSRWYLHRGRVAKSQRNRGIGERMENTRGLKAFLPRGPKLSNYY